MAITRREFEPDTMKFTKGFDTLKGEVRGIAVSGNPGPHVGGVVSSFYFQKVESIEDFLKVLEVSASASVQASLGNGSAKAKFASEVKMHDYSLYVVAMVNVRIGATQLDNPAFIPAAADLLATSACQEEFRKTYGDQFLSGITKGGEFYALMEIRTSNKTQYQDVEAKLSGGFAGGTVQGAASLKSVIQTITSFYQMTVMANQSGGGEHAVPLSPDLLADKASSFADTVTADHSFDYVATFEDYDILPHPPGGNPIDMQEQRDALERMAILQIRYQQKIDSADYVLLNNQEFVPFNSETLTNERNALNDTLNNLVEAASACFNNYKHCPMPTITDPVIVLPQRLTAVDGSNVTAAKAAAEDAEGHATACKQHAATVLEISKKIQSGPLGKGLVNDAKVALTNAEGAALLTKDAANVAIVAGEATIAAGDYAARAKSAVQQAGDAVQEATSLQGKIYEVGMAPYWTGPTVFHLKKILYANGYCCGWSSAAVHQGPPSSADPHPKLRIENLSIDPSGGMVEILSACNSPVVPPYNLCPLQGWDFVGIADKEGGNEDCMSGVGVTPSGFSVVLTKTSGDVSDASGKVLGASVILHSTQSKLRTRVDFKALCYAGSGISNSYINADGTIV